MSESQLSEGPYVVRAFRFYLRNLSIAVASLIKYVLPVAAAFISLLAVILFVVIVGIAVRERTLIAVLIVIGVILVLVSAILGFITGIGGFALYSLASVHELKIGILEPFKMSWKVKGRIFILAIVIGILSVIVTIILMIPFLAELARIILTLETSTKKGMSALLTAMRGLVVVQVGSVLVKMFLDFSYVFPFTNWRGAFSSVSASFKKVISLASDYPVSFIVLFLVFLFPDVLVFMWIEKIVFNPFFSNVLSLIQIVKYMFLVDPLYMLTLLLYLKDRNDPDINISSEFLPPPPPPSQYMLQTPYQPSYRPFVERGGKQVSEKPIVGQESSETASDRLERKEE